jgi:hypothetical protein
MAGHQSNPYSSTLKIRSWYPGNGDASIGVPPGYHRAAGSERNAPERCESLRNDAGTRSPATGAYGILLELFSMPYRDRGPRTNRAKREVGPAGRRRSYSVTTNGVWSTPSSTPSDSVIRSS